MAHQEHLDIINQGVDAWNRWRQESHEIGGGSITPDLRGAVLERANISQINLAFANLSGAILSNANLVSANLTRRIPGS